MEEHSNTYDVYMEFENEDKMSMVIKKLREEDILISNVVIIKKRSKTQSVVIQATMEAAKWKARHTVFREVTYHVFDEVKSMLKKKRYILRKMYLKCEE